MAVSSGLRLVTFNPAPKGATPTQRNPSASFNPAPKGATRRAGRAVGREPFQPSPAWGQRSTPFLASQLPSFNPAPHGGNTLMARRTAASQFQPSPAWGQPPGQSNRATALLSTQPHMGATVPWPLQERSVCFNPAPHVGNLVDCATLLVPFQPSPPRGQPAAADGRMVVLAFNPAPHEGNRLTPNILATDFFQPSPP